MNDKYLHYVLEDFLNDDSFIAYIKNENSKDILMWETIISEYPQLNSRIEEVKSFVNSIQFKNETPNVESIDSMWGNIISGIENKKDKPKPIIKNIYKIGLSVAASIILILMVSGLYRDKDKFINTSKAEIITLDLPDNSIVQLNVESKIFFSKSKWKDNRKIKLEGEAFFNVEKGQKFVVETPNSFVEVLGTSFNIYDRNSYLDIRCFTGKVRVISKNLKDTVTLNPGYGAKIENSKRINAYTFDINVKSIWKDSVITFETKKMKFVFEEIERLFNVNIVANKIIKNRYFTGKINISSQNRTLENICWPMHLKYSIEGDKVFISE